MSLDLTGLTEAQLRLFAVRCVRRVQHLMTDSRSISAFDVAERYTRGEATDEDLAAARDLAWIAWVEPRKPLVRRLPAEAAMYAADAWSVWQAMRTAAEAMAHDAKARDGDFDAALSAERAEQQRILDEIRKEVGP